MVETPEPRTAANYFIPIVVVIGGGLLMPSFAVFSTVIGPLLLLALTPFLLIGLVKYRQERAESLLPRADISQPVEDDFRHM